MCYKGFLSGVLQRTPNQFRWLFMNTLSETRNLNIFYVFGKHINNYYLQIVHLYGASKTTFKLYKDKPFFSNLQ